MFENPDTLLRDLIKDVVTENPTAWKVVQQTMLDQVANQALVASTTATLDPDVGIDDGVPPTAPTGVVATPLARKIAVAWDLPPDEDFVRNTIVEVTPPAPAAVQTLSVPTSSGSVLVDAPYPADTSALRLHTVKVWHVDLWGRTSPVAGPVNVTPAANTVDFLVADRILAGVLQAVVSITSGGRISAGGARMDDDGVSLLETASELTRPDEEQGSKLTPTGTQPFAHLQFFNITGAGGSRGAQLRADGNFGQGGTRLGQVLLDAVGDNSSQSSTGQTRARIQVLGGASSAFEDTRVVISPGLDVNGRLDFSGALAQGPTAFRVTPLGALTAESIISRGEINQTGTPFLVTAAGSVEAERFAVQYSGDSRVIPAGDVTTCTHNLGRIPNVVMGYWELPTSGQWMPISPDPSLAVSYTYITDNAIRIQNNTALARTVFVRVYK